MWKNKIMVIKKSRKTNVKMNNCTIEQVEQVCYLWTIIIKNTEKKKQISLAKLTLKHKNNCL